MSVMQGISYSKTCLFIPDKHNCMYSLYSMVPCGHNEKVGRKSGQTVAL